MNLRTGQDLSDMYSKTYLTECASASAAGQPADHNEARSGHPGGAGHLLRLPRDRPDHRLHVPEVPQREEEEKDSGRRIQVI